MDYSRFKKGVDFSGGTILHPEFTYPITDDVIRKIFKDDIKLEVVIQTAEQVDVTGDMNQKAASRGASSEKLIRELKALCDSIGLRTSNIYHRKRRVKPPHSKKEREFESWEIRIYKLHLLDKKFGKNIKRKGVGLLYGFRKRRCGSFSLSTFTPCQ